MHNFRRELVFGPKKHKIKILPENTSNLQKYQILEKSFEACNYLIYIYLVCNSQSKETHIQTNVFLFITNVQIIHPKFKK